MKTRIPLKQTAPFLMIFLLALVACEGDEVVDVEAPTITIYDPVNGEAFGAGGVIPFDALFEDNDGLATFKINIHSAEGHTHGRMAVNPLQYERSFQLSGKYAEVQEDIPVSQDATAGPHHLTVEAIDAVGNGTSFADGSSKELEIWITNEEMAHVHFQDENGVEVDEYEGELGVPLQFYGEITDPSGMLDHVTLRVAHLEEAGLHDHDHAGGGRIDQEDVLVYEGKFEVAGETAVRIEDLLADDQIVVSQEHLDALEAGEHLYLVVTVKDIDGNLSRFTIALHFD